MMNWSPHTKAAVQSQISEDTVCINVPNRTALLNDIADRFRTGQGFSVATLNLDHVVKLRTNPAFRAAYAQHTFVVADGNPIVWLSRLAGDDVQLVPGSELVDLVLALAAEHGVTVCFLGATQATLHAASDTLTARYPGLQVVAHIAPPMGFDPAGPTAETCMEQIAGSGAGLCLLALGAPKQELFAARAQEHLTTVGFLSIGAGLDFIAGTQTRAPAWVRAVAAEWLWRLLSNPYRLFARYRDCFVILPRLTLSALKARRQYGREEA